jgi:hypothetical protein
MSHYKDILTQFKNKDTLIASLVEIGVPREIIQAFETPEQIYNYSGGPSKFHDQQGDKCDVIIRRVHVGHLCNDIGFQCNEDGNGHAYVCDYAKNKGYGDDWMNNLRKTYAINETVAYHEEQGDMVEVVREEDGNVYVYAS